MTVQVKICGLSTPNTLAHVVAGGADMVGFVFYPPSPRAVTAEHAKILSDLVPPLVQKVGLFVDADDLTIAAVLKSVSLDMLQLHGSESPERVQAIRETFSKPVIKAIKVETAEDIAVAADYQACVDWLLFDAKAPKTMTGALPGGNAISFDWTLLQGLGWSVPWMLSGGLDADNVAQAIAITGAPAVDVSSGVEFEPGKKDPERIRAFLTAVKEAR
jgi:phosphoribosylanthranilate isomerase